MITVPLELSSLFSQQALLYYWASGQRTVILKSTVPCLILGYIPYVVVQIHTQKIITIHKEGNYYSNNFLAAC